MGRIRILGAQGAQSRDRASRGSATDRAGRPAVDYRGRSTSHDTGSYTISPMITSLYFYYCYKSTLQRWCGSPRTTANSSNSILQLLHLRDLLYDFSHFFFFRIQMFVCLLLSLLLLLLLLLSLLMLLLCSQSLISRLSQTIATRVGTLYHISHNYSNIFTTLDWLDVISAVSFMIHNV